MEYDFKKIEAKWQAKWEKGKIYEVKENPKKEKFYCLVEFPYPSGEGLHVGHPRSYTALDIVARKKRMEGKNVLYPIGWDAFGLPAENYAIKTGIQPAVATEKNIKNFIRQLKSLGLSFDWSREVNTTDPEYYKWTQWMFLQFFKHGLAYKDKIAINWCLKCKIGLANEEVVNGVCERCGGPVEKKIKEQWMIKITKYAERLLSGLGKVDYAPRIKEGQINWIGKSEGAEVDFGIKNSELKIKVFTTRPDTLFGATYMVLAPEHEIVEKLKSKITNWNEVEKYISEAKRKSDLERTELQKEKTGVELGGIKAINLVNNEEIPIWVADYVLAGYGTGAIMAVPAHDERDFAFAKKFSLPILPVIVPDLGSKKSGGKIDKMFSVLDQINQEFGKQKIKVWFNGTFGVAAYYGMVFDDPRDVDCGVLEKDFDRARKIIEGMGYKKVEDKENPKFKVSIYGAGDFTLEIGTFDHDLGERMIELQGYKYRVPEAGWFAECYHITAPKERRKGKNDLDRAIFLEMIAGTMGKSFTEIERGKVINSEFLNGLRPSEAIGKITKWLEEKHIGKKAVNYKLRDWVFSRQRYWGEPIPLVYCEKCGWVPVSEKDLPVELPKVKKYEPTETGESPLAAMEKWVKTKCPKCGGPARRETDTMPNWAGSSWYFLRYTDPKNKKEFAGGKNLKYWMPVDWYNGGMEHTTLHLLYSRFWYKFLYDIGAIPEECGDEPYKKRTSHGLILGEGGEKMSKSRGNVVNPDDIVARFGADTLRVYEMFMGPFDQAIPWDEKGVVGVFRFLERVWRLEEKVGRKDVSREILKTLHQTIKKVGEDIEAMKFNTAVSQMMILTNAMSGEEKNSPDVWKLFLKILAPFAPHLAEELWEKSGEKKSIHLEKWPEHDPALVVEAEIYLVLQINGKVRDTVKVRADIGEDDAKKVATGSEKVKKWIEGKEVRKIIFVKGKLVNIVV